MTAPTLDSLRDTLDGLQRRQARLLLARQLGFALVAACAVIAASLVLVANFASSAAAVLLVAIVSTTLIFSICSVAWRQSHRAQADQKALALYVEEKFPDLEQRLLTSIEFSQAGKKSSQAGVSPAFVEQLINDARSHVDLQRQQVERVGSSRESVIALVAGFSACLALVLLLQEFAQLRQAAQRLAWPFALEETVDVTSTAMPISLLVEPGDIEMQRGSPLTVTVRVENAQPGALTLRLQDDRLNWRDYPMLLDSSDSNGATFSYYLPAVVKDSNYLISLAGEEQSSRQYQINLYDLPEIEQIDVAMDFPGYTGEEDRIESDGGDIVAAEGTEVTLTVTFNKPVARAEIQFSGAESETDKEYVNGSLDVDGLQATTRFTVASDGVYRITATDLQGLQSESPLDYYIRAIEDQPPQFTLRRPGADRDVMPLEEVVIEVDASDDYGLGEFILNYAVVGEEDKEVDFLPAESVRSAQGSTLLYLEDLAVEPGDFISYYLTLADNNALKGPSEVVSDIYFLEVIPTDQEFRRSQQQGGGGGGGGQGGGESSALVSVQKDIIAATWKLRNRLRDASSTDIEADAEIIAESQREATGRAKMSIDRLSERLSFSDDSYDLAVENLSLAIEQMNLAANDLDSLQITTALKPEQLALQYVLKAEANINRTDISMNQNSGGGGGGGAQQEREDLRELFEMEMGQLENRYETPNSANQAGGTNAEEINKLEELARRQEALTRAQRNLARREQELAEEQRRRELERLRRQQEQLSADVEKLARELAQNGQGQQSQSRNSDSPQQGQQNQQRQLAGQGQQSTQRTGAEQSGDPSAQAAIERALEQMQQAAASDSAAIAAAQGQKALESLRDQQRELSEAGESSVSQIARRLGERGQALVRNQQALQEGLAEASRNQGLGQTRREARRDEALQTLLEAQRQQQRDIEEIEDMLRAVVTRGESEDRSLLTQAQAATRDLKPIRDEMATSNRVLRNGMLNLAIDMEQELGEQIQQLAQSLAQLNPSQTQDSASSTRQVAGDAQQLRQQIESLSQQAAEFNQRGETADDGNAPSLAQMREQLESSQALADSLSQQLAQQRGGSAQALRGDSNTVGTARSIRQQLSRQDIEAFLAQPELLKALLQPIVELEGALRAQAELESAATQLYSADDESIPDAYRELVEQYYRTLSEGDSGGVR